MHANLNLTDYNIDFFDFCPGKGQADRAEYCVSPGAHKQSK